MPLHIEVWVGKSEIGKRHNGPELCGHLVPELPKGKPLVGLSHIHRICLFRAHRAVCVQDDFRNRPFFARNLLPSCSKRGKQGFIRAPSFARLPLRNQRPKCQIIRGRCRNFFMLHLDAHHGKPMRPSDNDVVNPLQAGFLESHGLNIIDSCEHRDHIAKTDIPFEPIWVTYAWLAVFRRQLSPFKHHPP